MLETRGGGVGVGRSEFNYKRVIWEILVVMEPFCILTVVVVTYEKK